MQVKRCIHFQTQTLKSPKRSSTLSLLLNTWLDKVDPASVDSVEGEGSKALEEDQDIR